MLCAAGEGFANPAPVSSPPPPLALSGAAHARCHRRSAHRAGQVRTRRVIEKSLNLGRNLHASGSRRYQQSRGRGGGQRKEQKRNTHPVPRASPPVQRDRLVKVFLIVVTLQGEDRVRELFPLQGPGRTLAVMLRVQRERTRGFSASASRMVRPGEERGKGHEGERGSPHGRFPVFEGLDEDRDCGDVTVLFRVHRVVVERGGVLDEGRERMREAQVDDRFRVSLDDLRRRREGGSAGGHGPHPVGVASSRLTGDLLDLGAQGAVEAAADDADQGDVAFPRAVRELDEAFGIIDVDGKDERVRAQVSQAVEGLDEGVAADVRVEFSEEADDLLGPRATDAVLLEEEVCADVGCVGDLVVDDCELADACERALGRGERASVERRASAGGSGARAG